ncbi:MAG: FtsX-like permease family protein [Bacteroidales bacterium]|nr:FtsX-like permease family protein [Bacteroidales bacterium]
MVIGFGILGTVIMMTAERRREMGVMVAVGLQRSKLALITAMETLMLALSGVLAGVVIGIPLLEYMYRHPVPASGEMKEMIEEYGMEAVLVFSKDPAIYTDQALIVFFIAMITLLYPVISIFLLKPIKALRN